MMNKRLVEDQIRTLVLILYKGLHTCSYLSSSQKAKEQLLSSHVVDTNRYTKSFPLLEKNYANSTFDNLLHPNIFSTIIDATTDLEKLATDNKWIIPREYPSNNCTNTAVVRERQTDSPTKNLEYTLAHQFVNAKRRYQSGSCYSCTRDRNPSTLKESILIMNSQIYNETGCSLSMLLEEEVPYFRLSLKLGENHERYTVKSIVMNSQMGAIIKPMIKKYLNDRSEYLIEKFDFSDEGHKIKKSSVVLEITGIKDNNSPGVLKEIAKRGYLPLIETSSIDDITTEIRFKTLKKFLAIHKLIGNACNPLKFIGIEQVMNPDINLEMDVESEIWPIQYIGAHEGSIQKLNAEIYQDQKQSEFRDILFIDNKMNFDEDIFKFDFFIDPIRFWM